MKEGTFRTFYILLGVLQLVSSILSFLSGNSPLQLFQAIFGAILILYGLFQKRGHMNTAFYLSMFVLMIFYGLLIAYIYEFTPVYAKNLLFYMFTVFFIFFVIIFIFEYRRVTQYKKEVEPYEKALNIDPKDATALNNKGATYAEFKAFQEAIEYFDKAIEIDPNDAAAWHNKGVILEKRRKYQEAIKYYDKALEVDPGFVNAKNSGKIILEN